MKFIKRLIITLSFAVLVASPIVTTITPISAFAAGPTTPTPAPKTCDQSFLGIPPWYRGLTDADCNIKSPNTGAGKTSIALSDFIWHIVLNVIEIGLYLAGFIALGFVLYGGFQFLTGGSNPGQIEKARMTILNACIGLVISIAAIAITNLIFKIIYG